MDGRDGEESAFAPHIETFAETHAGAEIVVAQTAQGTVIALDAASGAPLWRWVTHDPHANMERAGERIFVSTAISDRPMWVELDPAPAQPDTAENRAQTFSRTHTRTRPVAVTALRASDGAVLWRTPFYCLAIGPNVRAEIMVAGDMLLTAALSFERGTSELLALDIATGAPRWRHRLGPMPLISGTGHPRVLWAAEDRLAVFTIGEPREAKYLILDAMTGAVLWQGEQAPDHASALPLQETSGMRFTIDHVITWPHHIVRATRAESGVESGDEVWRMSLDELLRGRTVETSLLAEDGRLYLFWRNDSAMRLRAMRATTGQVLWRWRSPVWVYALFLARQAIQRGQQASRTGHWRPLVSDALRFRWLHPIRPNGACSVVAASGRLYLATPLGACAISARDGRQLWHALPGIAVTRLHIAVHSHGVQ